MTETIRRNLELMREARQSVSRDNPQVQAIYEQVDRAIGELDLLAQQSESNR